LSNVHSSNKQAAQQQTHWYQVPVLWLGLILTIFLMVGLWHLIYVSTSYKEPESATIQKGDKELRAWRGTPFTQQELKSASDKTSE
jgi:hypothetical protein